MVIDIFIRSYEKDFVWLEYALRSIHKNVTGFRNIIVAVPDARPLSHLTAEQVIEIEDLPDGYIGQQLTKMQAWRYTDADAILFWDSDVVAIEPVDVLEFKSDGKPIIYKTKYTSIDVPWKPITESCLGFPVTYEYMRRMPLLYWANTIRNTEEYICGYHDCTLREYLSNINHRAFSEFNAIGALAEKYYPDQYVFIDTETVEMPPIKVVQFWSWGGVTNEIKRQLDKI